MDHVLGLRCVLCGAEYGVSEVDYVCPKHGDQGILDVVYDYDLIGRRLSREGLAQNPDYSIWRYSPLLPVEPDSPRPPLQVGWTPMYYAQRLGERLGLPHLYVKDDGRNPTASFKDRASAIAVVKVLELGREIVTTASSGNAAAALAGLAASVGLPTVIFVPETAPQAKVAQLLIFGATVILVQGTYDQAFDLCLAASKEYGWYCRNTAYNPYMSEGKKTASFEICEQLGWQAPDRVFVAVGDGCIIGGLWKGFRDLMALGWIERMPKLMGVQAEGSAVLVRAWQAGTEEIEPLVPHTIADSISVGMPRDRIKALRAVRETGGEYVAVSDEEILEAMRVLAREAAVFAEPAGATGFAGLQKLLRGGKIDPDERIVVLVTGNGLKDVPSAIKATGEPYRVEPKLEALDRCMMHDTRCKM
jgi:threonine synthase